MDLADSAFHFRFRWEALPPFAHRFEKNALSLKSLLHIRHLLHRAEARIRRFLSVALRETLPGLRLVTFREAPQSVLPVSQYACVDGA